MISVRRAHRGDAIDIAEVHVAAWRSAYPGILPDGYLTNLSITTQAAYYSATLHGPTGVFVATVSGADLPAARASRSGNASAIIGFATAGRSRSGGEIARHLGEGEIETLYVLDDWRERGIGRRLMGVAAAYLAESGCRSVYLWVLRDNPSRWFYQRLGGKPTVEATIRFAGRNVPQTAFVWDPIERLLAASPQEL